MTTYEALSPLQSSDGNRRKDTRFPIDMANKRMLDQERQLNTERTESETNVLAGVDSAHP